jgi:hypothetical protein
VLALYLAALVAICVMYPPGAGVVRFLVAVAAASVVLTVVCWITGEPPRWSWGEARHRDR